jgi:hemerythrin superfamily protein
VRAALGPRFRGTGAAVVLARFVVVPRQEAIMDAIELLTTQHAEVESLFDKLDHEADEPDWRDLCGRLVDRLTMHAALEEEVFYPAVARLGEREPVAHARDEHAKIERMVEALRAPHLQKRACQDQLHELRRTVQHHAAEEENDLMPRSRHRLGAAGLRDLGRQMEERMRAGEVAEVRMAAGGGERR